MHLNNEIVKPLVTIMDRGFDVGRILETIAESASAGMGLDSFKWGEEGERKENQRKRA